VPALAGIIFVSLGVWWLRESPPIVQAPAPLAPLPMTPTAPPGHAPVAHSKPRRSPAHRSVPAAVSVKLPRTIHFVTQSGTQIIWTLDPNLEL
jgi:hypothetical protein